MAVERLPCERAWQWLPPRHAPEPGLAGDDAGFAAAQEGCTTAAAPGQLGGPSPYYLTNWVEGAPVPVAGVIGRDRELAAVAAFLDAVPLAPCGLVLEGAAGIGKTTVWRAGAAQAAGRSYTVLSCRPAESEVTLSSAALGDLLDGVLDRALPIARPNSAPAYYLGRPARLWLTAMSPRCRRKPVADAQNPTAEDQPPNPAHEPSEALA
jgi:hypothetical protein